MALTYRQRWGIARRIRSAVAWRLRDRVGLYVYGIYARPLGIVLAERPPDDGYTHHVFDAADLDELLRHAADPRLGLDERFIRDAIAKGDGCDAVFHRGRLISYTWLSFTPTHDRDGVYVAFGPRYRYSYKAYTVPEYRGLHANAMFRPLTDAYCARRGRDTAIAFVAIDNDSSIRATLRVGNRRIGIAGYWKLGRWFVPFRTRAVRDAGLRFFRPPERATGAEPDAPKVTARPV